MELIATIEMKRLKKAIAWGPIHKCSRHKLNAHATRYTFDDTSQLTVYSNGDAAWYYKDEKGNSDGLQRWPNWHYCNKAS